MSSGERLRRSASEQDGFTIIEVLIGIVLIAVALLAVMGTLDVAAKATLGAQRHEQAISVAQREMERLKSIDYEALGHTATPTAEDPGTEPGDDHPRNPNAFVSGSNLLIKSSYRNSASATALDAPENGEPFVTGTEPSDLGAGPITFTSGNTTGTIYRYVTWRAENCATCDGEDSKRITVAVLLSDRPGIPGPDKPVWISSVVTPPPESGTPATGETVTSQPFFLYNTPCQPFANGTVARSAVANTATHNTTQSGTSCETASSTTRPDLMWNVAPPGLTTDPYANLSSDYTRPAVVAGGATPNPRNRGKALIEPTTNNCQTDYYSSANAPTQRRWKHTWATNPMPDRFDTAGTNPQTALSIMSETIDGGVGSGVFCVMLRRQLQNGTVVNLMSAPQEFPAVNPWPATPLQLLSFTVTHDPFTIYQGERLLITVGLRNTSTRNVNLLYDHPAYPSVLTVSTTTPLDGN